VQQARVELSVDLLTFIAAVVTAIATSAGAWLTIRKITECVLVWKVSTKVSTKDGTLNSAEAAAMVLLAFKGKAHPGLGAGDDEAGDGSVDERETPQIPRPRAPARSPDRRGGGRSGKRRRRRPARPRADTDV
jgi:hypothetical protein